MTNKSEINQELNQILTELERPGATESHSSLIRRFVALEAQGDLGELGKQVKAKLLGDPKDNQNPLAREIVHRDFTPQRRSDPSMTSGR